MSRPVPGPTFGELLRVFLRIGLLSFGGPAGQIALMHDELVERRKWITEERFLHALSYCMLLPGPEAQQLATYVGWTLHRTRGAIAAGSLFVLPGFFVVLALSALYATFQRVPVAQGALFGMKAAVLAIVVQALVKVGKRALRSRFAVALAALAFVAIALFAVPFPIVVVSSALLGLAFGPRATSTDDPAAKAVDAAADPSLPLTPYELSRGRAVTVIASFAAAWLAPLVLVRVIGGADSPYWTIGAFFAKTSVVTFGGAYAALAYVAQEAVSTHAWLSAREMVDALGLAETTPGPLMLVLEMVGFLAAHRAPNALGAHASPLLAGTLGAALTVWVLFLPCFLFVVAGAPWIERLRANQALARALAGVTAAVVGVIANLTFYFGVHASFGKVALRRWGAIASQLPDVASIDVVSVALGALSYAALVRWKVSVPKLVGAAALVGTLLHLALR